jgi:tetratricopeptide (TPR) repeat protein
MMGKILLRKADPSAGKYLQNYLGHLEKKEYLKEINYCLALHHLLNGDRQKYEKYCAVVKTAGMELNERDREALYDASVDYMPDVNLVKAKLFMDGGYVDAARKAISAYEASHSPVPAYEMEYHLLKGRLAESQANTSLAMAEYRKVITLAEQRDYYFASDAALRLGDLCKTAGQKELAADYYRKSIRLYKKRYYEYIEDKAAKGLLSLEGKQVGPGPEFRGSGK